MPAPRELLARRVARELLARHAVTTYPVDPVGLAAAEGVEVAEMPEISRHCYGALALAENRFTILVAANCPSRGHRRFTIAHELGHYSIEGHVEGLTFHGDTAYSTGHFQDRRNPLEVEADHFASELLIPGAGAQPIVDEGGPALEAIRRLARTFDTSLTCAAIRFAGLVDTPLIILQSDGLTVEWTARSAWLDNASWARLPLKGEWAPPGSATRRLADRREDVFRGGQMSAGGYLRDWFPGAPSEIEVEEEAVGLGAYGRVLTVLTCPDLPEPDELYHGDEHSDEEPRWTDAMRPYRLG